MADLRRNQQAFKETAAKIDPPRRRNRFLTTPRAIIRRPIICCNRSATSWKD